MKDNGLINVLLTEARNKRLSRRNFIHHSLAAGMTIAGAGSLWSTDVWAQTPQRGGTFRVGMRDGNTTDSLDPGTTASDYMIQLNHVFRSFLTEITETNELGPDIATSWTASADASEWRFELAKNVVFHSGKKFTSADAIASLNYHRGEATASAAKTLLLDVEDIKADGDNAIIIKLMTGNADLPYLLSDYHLVMCPAKPDGGIDWESGDGTGPYKLLNHDPGIRSECVRHDGWHREGAYFDAVEMITLNDGNARQTALITGDVDAIAGVDLKTINLLSRNQDLVIESVESAQHDTLPMHCDTAPFDNVDVRLALKYAINRDDIIEKIFYGHATIGNDHPIASSMPFYSELEQRQYDPDKARFHLKQAGMENLTVQLHAADAAFEGAVDLAVLYSEHAKAAGLNIEVVRETNDGYWSSVWLVKPFCVVGWGARPTPDVMFTLAYAAEADWNESRWKNPRFNELLLLTKKELDSARRTEMYAEMMTLCRDDGGTVTPLFGNYVMGRRKNVQHGPSIASNWTLDGARSYHRWWFSS